MKRLVFACAGLACEVVLIYRGQWLIAGLTGAGVMLVIVLMPAIASFCRQLAIAASVIRQPLDPEPEPEPGAPPPLTPAIASGGEGYACSRCGGPGETTWDSAAARAARRAGVCGGCFGGVLEQLKECRSSDEDPTMQVAAGTPAGRHERAEAPDCPPVPDGDPGGDSDTYPSAVGGTSWQQPA